MTTDVNAMPIRQWLMIARCKLLKHPVSENSQFEIRVRYILDFLLATAEIGGLPHNLMMPAKNLTLFDDVAAPGWDLIGAALAASTVGEEYVGGALEALMDLCACMAMLVFKYGDDVFDFSMIDPVEFPVATASAQH